MTTTAMSASKIEGAEIQNLSKLQDRYAAKTALSLTLFAVFFFIVAFLSPYLAILTVLLDGEAEDRRQAVSQLAGLEAALWTALPVLFFGALLFGLLVTKRVAGPLAHLERCALEWSRGYVAHRVSFLRADRLDELADKTNQAWAKVEHALAAVQQHNHEIRRIVDSLVVAGSAPHENGANHAERVCRISDASDAIKTALQPFHLMQKR